MTATPDPKTVREIAREYILDCGQNADDIGVYVGGHHGPGLTKHEYGAWCSAVREAIRTATIVVSWPDEQAQAECDAEPKPCVCGDLNCMPYWRPVHEQMNTMRIRLDKTSADFTKSLLEQVCEFATELDELRARREDWEAERDADVRAVAEAVDVLDFVLENGYSADVVEGARTALHAHFADRIAVLNAGIERTVSYRDSHDVVGEPASPEHDDAALDARTTDGGAT